jgi:hypothetical protein
MNKRIEELAKQAGFHADKYGHCKSHLGDAPSDADDIVDLEKFAELIIEKCGEIADENSERGIISAYIDKYFGVK